MKIIIDAVHGAFCESDGIGKTLFKYLCLNDVRTLNFFTLYKLYICVVGDKKTLLLILVQKSELGEKVISVSHLCTGIAAVMAEVHILIYTVPSDQSFLSIHLMI